MPDGARVKDLLALLAISENLGAVVVMDGQILKADDTVGDRAPLHVLQPLSGG
jgi:sulfur carrier protein ThiS